MIRIQLPSFITGRVLAFAGGARSRSVAGGQAGKATNLDSDKLDGNDSAAFLQSSTPTYAVFNSSPGTEVFLAGASASCDPGDKILGGGFDGLNPGDGVIVSDATAPGGGNHGVSWANPDAGTTVTAVCADFPQLRPPDETPR